MATLEDLNVYYSRLEKTLHSGESSLDYNEDRSHNAMVMRLMFNEASTVRMYCGELSILRNGFREHVRKEVVGGEKIVDRMLDSLDAFLGKEGVVLEVIFENYKKEYLEDLVRKESFDQGLSNGRIKLYKLDDDFTLKKDLAHFAVADNKLIRIEQDKIMHSALCSFNDTERYEFVNGNFDKLQFISSPVCNGVA